MCSLQSANGVRLYIQQRRLGGGLVHRVESLCTVLICAAEIEDEELYYDALTKLAVLVGPGVLSAPRLV